MGREGGKWKLLGKKGEKGDLAIFGMLVYTEMVRVG